MLSVRSRGYYPATPNLTIVVSETLPLSLSLSLSVPVTLSFGGFVLLVLIPSAFIDTVRRLIHSRLPAFLTTVRVGP